MPQRSGRPAPSRPLWWDRDIHAGRRPRLIQRNQIIEELRRFFHARDILEIDTASLQVSPGNEAHLQAFATALEAPGQSAKTLYLHTSPEFAAKKVLAAGESRIVAFAKVFRNGERGPLHHPEFTMVEWYRAHETYEALMDDCSALVTQAAAAIGCQKMEFRERSCDPRAQPVRLSVADAFMRYSGVDLLGTIAQPGISPDRDRLADDAISAGIRVAHDDTWSDIFSRVLVERIEPKLGLGAMTILDQYPTHEAALARPCAHDARVAERFELYACGVELANAFGELTDPIEQRRRFELEMAEKERIYGCRYPIDEDFLDALAHMPDACGAALGLDRLVMLLTGARHIDQVLWTPVVDPFNP